MHCNPGFSEHSSSRWAIGIFLFSLLSVKIGISKKPSYPWKVLWGGGMLAGIGFTMALFVAGLAFDVG
ncbi:MAG: Na+/H+ antiporter NhaA, partial [Muribaculaceae bacterium]|nr:Na+/H+ antiporter NhaA [Muribaculaceae bacterium]